MSHATREEFEVWKARKIERGEWRGPTSGSPPKPTPTPSNRSGPPRVRAKMIPLPGGPTPVKPGSKLIVVGIMSDSDPAVIAEWLDR